MKCITARECQHLPVVSEELLSQVRASVGNCPLDLLKKITYRLDTEIHKKIHICSKHEAKSYHFLFPSSVKHKLRILNCVVFYTAATREDEEKQQDNLLLSSGLLWKYEMSWNLIGIKRLFRFTITTP